MYLLFFIKSHWRLLVGPLDSNQGFIGQYDGSDFLRVLMRVNDFHSHTTVSTDFHGHDIVSSEGQF